MSYGERSKQFDWFKTTNQTNKPKKDSLKTVWKFLKIFIYLSLFVFSMIGCVQSLIIKIDNYVGQGFEVYQSESVVAPHITQISINKNDEILSGTYKVEVQTKENIYISSKEDGEMLESIHQTINLQDSPNKNLKLSDAWKGVNEGFRIKSDIEELATIGKVHRFSPTSPYSVLSSKAAKGFYNLQGDIDFGNYELWIPIKNNDKTTFQKAPLKFYNFKDGKATTPFTNQQINDEKNPRNLLRRAMINHFFSNNPFFTDFLSIDPATKSEQDEQIKFNNLQRIAYGQILSYLGIQDALDPTSTSTNKEFKILDDYMLTMGYGETNYYPVVSWSSAWSLGPFYGLFVYPIGKVFTYLLGSMAMIQGWEVLFAIVIIVILSRIIAFLLSFKSTLQQTKMQELNAKKAMIDAKYAPYKGNKQMENRQKQEVADMYKKAGINPLGALGTLFVTMPLFIALWRVIGGVQQVKSTIWLGINFSATSYSELFAGHLQYLPLMILAAVTQLFAQIYPRLLTKKKEQHQINVYQKAAMKKNNRTQNIMMGVMVFLSLIFSAGIQIYWIIGGLWRIFEVYITHKIIHYHKKVSKSKKSSYELTSN